jgi:hypothetical protein
MNSFSQTPPATTLNQAIEVVKARKTAELNFTTQVYSNAPKPLTNAIPAQKNNTDTSLKLWSIRGLGGDLRAEVIYQGQIKEVSFAAENIRVGNWFLVGLTENEVQLAMISNGKLSKKQIHLKLPQRSELATLWPNPLLEGVNLQDGSLRPPVPLSMLKP